MNNLNGKPPLKAIGERFLRKISASAGAVPNRELGSPKGFPKSVKQKKKVLLTG